MDPTDEPEARVVVVGDPVEDGDALFVGSLEDAKAFVHALPPAERKNVAIVTEGRIYDPREV